MGIPARPRNPRARLRVALLVLLVVGMFGALFAHGNDSRMFAKRLDFRAFYCAGSAVLRGRDPYLAEPLRSCEVAETIAAGERPIEFVAMPAPLPGYSLALFASFARLPLPDAAVLYTIVLIAALSMSVLALQTLTGYPPLGILGALALCDLWVSMLLGQIIPISLMFLCAAAAMLARDRPGAAAACAAGAMIEPHIALPACIALFVFERRARVPLVAAAAILVAISLLTTGWQTNVEYVTKVLAAHALSESDDIVQFSLTTVLHRLGLDAVLALKLADLSYVAMIVFGLVIARRLYAQSHASELLVLIPPAFALLGGPFLHTTQMAVAVPALLVLVHRFPRRRALLSAALVIMAIPWFDIAENSFAPGLIAAAAVTAVLALIVLRINAVRTITIVLIITATAAGERYIRVHFPPVHLNVHAELARAAGGSLLASTTWAIDARSTVSTYWYVASHLPAWTGLLLMVVAASALARTSSAAGRHHEVFQAGEKERPHRCFEPGGGRMPILP